MIRFILKRETYDGYSGCRQSSYVTLDLDVPELQARLESGGLGESGYDHTELTGVEILPPAPVLTGPETT